MHCRPQVLAERPRLFGLEQPGLRRVRLVCSHLVHPVKSRPQDAIEGVCDPSSTILPELDSLFEYSSLL